MAENLKQPEADERPPRPEQRLPDRRPRDERGGADEQRTEAEARRLSTAPAEETDDEPAGEAVGLGALGWARWAWRQLTSMRVALLLLFLLSLAAIPGSLVPQESVDPVKADDFVRRHETLAPIYQKLGLFNVYSSVWFSAIYILLFISLAGCILPRSRQFVWALRGRPPASPRNLRRMPVHTTWQTTAAPEQVLDAAERVLRRRRFRTHTAGGAVAAEKGYLREAGNLLFHISLFGLLIAVAVGHLWSFSGGKLVVEGDGFANTLTQYDDYSPGPLYRADDLDAFGFTLEDFRATFAASGSQRGSARTFEAEVGYWTSADADRPKRATIKVNDPLRVGGSKVYLIGHGYAPVVTVRDGQGDIAFRGPVPCLPLDANITSRCVIKVPDAKDGKGKKDQLAFSGIFAPTAKVTAERGPHSVFPALVYPALYLTAYHGSLGIDSGLAQNVYQLDTTHLKQFTEDGGPLSRILLPEEKIELPGGAGTLTFDSIKRYATFQISHHPGNGTALASSVLAILGLIGSLFVQRRRVWVRAGQGPEDATVVEMAGLARTESARIADELADLAVRLQADAPPRPEPSPSQETPGHGETDSWAPRDESGEQPRQATGPGPTPGPTGGPRTEQGPREEKE